MIPSDDPFNVSECRILITGSSKGLGLGIARHLSEAGAVVALHGRDQTALHAAAGGMGAPAVVTGDLRDPAQVEQVVADTVRQLGGLDGVVNNAGGAFVSRAEDLSARGFEAVVTTNLTTAFLVSRASYPHLIEGGGSIVNISSLASIRPSPALVHYSAAKAGVNQLSSSLAAEWAGTGIRVNAVAVGSIATEAGLRANYDDDPERIAAAARRIGVGRLGSPQDVALLVHFLISAASSFVNGSTIVLDGGPPDDYVV